MDLHQVSHLGISYGGFWNSTDSQSGLGSRIRCNTCPSVREKACGLLGLQQEQDPKCPKPTTCCEVKPSKGIEEIAKSYWENQCNEIQEAFDVGNTRKMYEKISVALGPQTSKLAPLKSSSGQPITDKNLQMKRWEEHYSKLYSQERYVGEGIEDK